MKRGGFSLIELIVAAALSAVLMGGVLLVVGALGRDRRRLAAEDARPRHELLVELLCRDLANAQTMAVAADGRSVVLVGHGGIDPRSLTLTGRLTRVTYKVGGGSGGWLLRYQEYLDDPIHRDRWVELAAQGVTSLSVSPRSSEVSVPVQEAPDAADEAANTPRRSATPIQVPSTVRLRLGWVGGAVTDEMLQLR